MKTIKPLIVIVCGLVCTSVAYGQLGLGTMTRGTIITNGGTSVLSRTSHRTELADRSAIRNARSKAKRHKPSNGVMTNVKSSSATQINGNTLPDHQGSHHVDAGSANGLRVNSATSTTINGTNRVEAAAQLNSESLADKAIEKKEKITTVVAEKSGDAMQKVKESRPSVKAEGSTHVNAAATSNGSGTATNVNSKVGAASTISKQ